MKKKLFYLASVIIIAASFNGCEGLNNCKTCSLNTYDSNGDLISKVKEAEYCDAKLVTIQATPDYTDPVTGTTTKWVCN